ncbi:MAG: SUF system FeS assembly protein NifU family [Erysipelotrichaceae bacterium]|nr:MAG: SUF system FeS assembly protein NifU [Erysipelotrichaceae bacterium]TXT18769.1 MAG: SUF system FeS assembly protein NifU family [Erysipelotrichaceae bacterium]
MSDYLKDPQIHREIIMDHYQHPRNHHLSEDAAYHKAHMASESCIDDLTVMMKIDQGIITDVCFDGVGCTISTASTSILTDLIKGKTIEEAKVIVHSYYEMINLVSVDEDLLQEAVAFQNVGKQANRIKCATIGFKAIEQMIKEEETNDKQ